MAEPIRHIVFDLGGVLINWDPAFLYCKLIPDYVERHHFLTEVCSPSWNREQDGGRDWPSAEAEAIARHPDKAELIRAYRARWHEMIGGAIEPTVAIVERLRGAGRDLTALTNWAGDTFVEARGMFPFLGYFRHITVSGDIRLMKPDRAIYDHHVAASGIEPTASLFIDDSAANVAGARAAGWQAIRFTTPEELEADLAARGL